MKKLIIAIIAAFVAITVTDFLIHQVWLQSSYVATKSHWRPEADMKAHTPWIFLAEFVVAIGFATIYVKALAEKGCIKCAFFYGLCMGLVAAGSQIMMFAVVSYPGSLIIKWVVACIVQCIVVALVLFKVCKQSSPGASVA